MSTDAKKVSDRIVSVGPGKTVLMPDIYAEEYSVEASDLEIVEPPTPDAGESVGFNPYDTGTLHKK